MVSKKKLNHIHFIATWEVDKTLAKRVEAYLALPWYKRIFRRLK